MQCDRRPVRCGENESVLVVVGRLGNDDDDAFDEHIVLDVDVRLESICCSSLQSAHGCGVEHLDGTPFVWCRRNPSGAGTGLPVVPVPFSNPVTVSTYRPSITGMSPSGGTARTEKLKAARNERRRRVGKIGSLRTSRQGVVVPVAFAVGAVGQIGIRIDHLVDLAVGLSQGKAIERKAVQIARSQRQPPCENETRPVTPTPARRPSRLENLSENGSVQRPQQRFPTVDESAQQPRAVQRVGAEVQVDVDIGHRVATAVDGLDGDKPDPLSFQTAGLQHEVETVVRRQRTA